MEEVLRRGAKDVTHQHLFRTIFAQACYWKLHSHVTRELLRNGWQDRRVGLRPLPDELDALGASLFERDRQSPLIVEELLVAYDQKREVDTSAPVFQRYDKTSRQIAKVLENQLRRQPTGCLDPHYPWTTDQHSKNHLMMALGIKKARFSGLLAKHGPKLTQRKVKHIQFKVALKLLTDRLKTVSAAKARAFAASLLGSDQLLNADPDRLGKLQLVVEKYRSLKSH
ncbi:MAG: hypothetical protein FJ397_12325 [Verrucomicrobia bacterium]|nr:hypothetical protein [Verrucomicrobiota bacterium]